MCQDVSCPLQKLRSQPGHAISWAKTRKSSGPMNWRLHLLSLEPGPKMGLQYLGYCRTIWCPLCIAKSLVPVVGISGTNLGCYNKHVPEYEGKTAPLAFRQLRQNTHQSSKSQSQCHCQRQASLLSPHAGMWPSTASNEWVSSAIRSMYIFTWKKKKRSRFVKSSDWKIEECNMIHIYSADSIVKLKFMSRYYVKCITAIHDAQCVFFA